MISIGIVWFITNIYLIYIVLFIFQYTYNIILLRHVTGVEKKLSIKVHKKFNYAYNSNGFPESLDSVLLSCRLSMGALSSGFWGTSSSSWVSSSALGGTGGGERMDTVVGVGVMLEQRRRLGRIWGLCVRSAWDVRWKCQTCWMLR